MTDPMQLRLFFAWLVFFSLAQTVFALFPGLDLRISGLFFGPDGAFTATRGPVPFLNDITRTSSEAIALVAVLGVIAGGLGRQIAGAQLRCLTYLAANVMLAPGLIVNVLLKSHVGRARPDQISDFGGLAQFTPAWQVTDQCARNCSFSSGDVALIATLALAGMALLWPHLTRLQKASWSLSGGALVLGVGLMRIALGRHFVSDVIFSILISAAVALALYPLLRIGEARQSLTQLDFGSLRTRLDLRARNASARA